MVNLQDWDLPVPDWVIFGWLGLLEAIILVGMTVFVVSLFEQGDIIPTLPLTRSPIVLIGLVAVLTVVFTVFRMDDVSMGDLIRRSRS
ncbi:hypothetical protein [Halosolutus halophilus]|uniref:hypothetical protein n=1 Tax=Halosolutus halophilus TaxID=1552990 RepID=UPI0022350555|nr:hypothetical protein [Halosolutus halophilus]